MKTSDSITKISKALALSQKKIGAAKKGSNNPFFKSKYADLGAVMEVCKDPCNEQGIAILQPVGRDELGPYVETLLLHESGEYISDRIPVISKTQNNPQDQGSAITYARRYGLQSLLFIPAEDDDGEAAVGRTPNKPSPKPTSNQQTRPTGKPGAKKEEPERKLATNEQRIEVQKALYQKGKTRKDLFAFITRAYKGKYKNFAQLSEEQATYVIDKIKSLPDKDPETGQAPVDEENQAAEQQAMDEAIDQESAGTSANDEISEEGQDKA